MMKKYILILVLIFVSTSVFAKTQAASLNATGYDWLGYSKEDKYSFAHLLYVIHGVDKSKNTPVEIIKRLDDFYYGAIAAAKKDPLNVDEDDSLKVRCVDVVTKGLTLQKAT